MALITKELITTETVKCAVDPVYFLNRYGKINHPVDGVIPLLLYQFQEQTIREFQNHRFNVTLKSRQLGLSTISAGYVAWFIMFQRSKEVVIVANTKKTAQGFITKVKRFIAATPIWLRPKIITDNKGEIELGNGSKCNAYATTTDSARSESASLLIIDEAAIIETNTIAELWSAARPTLSTGGSGIIISTPKGVGNFFHQIWTGAEEGTNNFNPIKLHWTMHPIYAYGLTYKDGKPTSPWYENECKDMSEREIAQELNCVDGDTIVTIRDSLTGFIENITMRELYSRQF